MQRDNRFGRAGRRCALWLVLVCLVCQGGGCGDHIQSPSAQKLAQFKQAGPAGPAIDMDRIVRAKMQMGPYRAVVSDVLQLELPSMLFPDVSDALGSGAPGSRTVHTCRVDELGMITLPDGRQIRVAGKSLGQIESAVVHTYYPDFVRTRPAVYAQVLEYRMLRVQVMGAVARPGIYRLRHDQMSLVGLLMEAGGITDDGAALIRITRSARADVASHEKTTVSQVPSGSGSQGGEIRTASLPASQRRDRIESLPSETCVSFEREGPLATTGWLSIDVDGVRRARQWFDIGSDFQRRTALQEVAASSTEISIGELDEKLLELAGFLSSVRTNEQVVAFRQPVSEWGVRKGTHFFTYLGDLSTEEEGTDDVDSVMVKPVFPDRPESVLASSAEADITFALPVKGLDIPVADVALEEGDSVVIERPPVQYVSVLGLVLNPANLPFLPNSEHTLAEALAFVGGLDMVADPRFVTVYRLNADGTVASVTYRLIDPDKQEQFTEALALKLKPGDVVSVENTPRTRANTFLNTIFRISLGLYYDPGDLLE